MMITVATFTPLMMTYRPQEHQTTPGFAGGRDHLRTIRRGPSNIAFDTTGPREGADYGSRQDST